MTMNSRKFWSEERNPGLALASLVAAIALAFAFASPAIGQSVTILVNGQQVGFDQPPVEKAGRVFVPLRGVFERLGASVVYENGLINATGLGRSVSLRIGSTTAIVNGSQQQVDVAPFLIGSRTMVPLRFISQALGAAVNYDNGSQTVSITTAGPPATATPRISVDLVNERPAPNGVVPARRPAVSGSFSRPVDPNTVRVTLDGRDVSSTTYVSSTNFLFSPSYDLAADVHTVRVTGKEPDGTPFDRTWSFTSGTSAAQNFITGVTPSDGTTVGGTFTVSGTTLPNSRVHITALGTADMGGYFRVSTGTYDADVAADSSGHFSQQVSLNVVSGGDIGVRVTSIAPATNSASTITLHYHG
jgi:hypothetical protein